MKRASTLAATVLLLGALAGCGGSDSSSAGDSAGSTTGDSTEETTGSTAGGDTGNYCTDLKAAKAQFDQLGSNGDLSGFDDAINTMKALADEAPSDIAADWAVLSGGLDTIQQAMADADVTAQDLTDPQALQNLDPEVLKQLQEKFASLNNKDFTNASEAIATQAKEACGVDLNSSTPSTG